MIKSAQPTVLLSFSYAFWVPGASSAGSKPSFRPAWLADSAGEEQEYTVKRARQGRSYSEADRSYRCQDGLHL